MCHFLVIGASVYHIRDTEEPKNLSLIFGNTGNKAADSESYECLINHIL